nr:hypothetical protein [uncultured Aminipila sp.]
MENIVENYKEYYYIAGAIFTLLSSFVGHSIITLLTSSKFEIFLFSKEKRILYGLLKFTLYILMFSSIFFITSIAYRPMLKENIFEVFMLIYGVLFLFIMVRIIVHYLVLDWRKDIYNCRFLDKLRLVIKIKSIAGLLGSICNISVIKKSISMLKYLESIMLILSSMYIFLYYSNLKIMNTNQGYLFAYKDTLLLALMLMIVIYGVFKIDSTTSKKCTVFYIYNEGVKYYILHPLNRKELLFSDNVNEAKSKKYLIYSRSDLYRKTIYKEEAASDRIRNFWELN